MLKYQSHEEYGELVLKEKGKWEQIDAEEVDCGVCQFCEHKSKYGWRIKNIEDGRKLLVGTDCVFVLCNLNKSQQKALKYKSALKRNREKYSKVAEYLRLNHEIIKRPFDINSVESIVGEIVYKVEYTTGLNPFWFEQYQKLTGKNLKELM